MFVSILFLTIFFFVYLSKGFSYLVIKNVVIMSLFIGILFYIKFRQSITIICHLLIIISWLNNNVNIFLFDQVNFFAAWLTSMNIIFAFHTLGSRSGFFYSIVHFIPILAHFVLKRYGIDVLNGPPQILAFSDAVLALVL